MTADKYKLSIEKKKNLEIESFIEQYGSVFHSYDYIRLLGTDYRCVTVKSQSENILAVLPLVKTRRHYLNAYHIPPYTYQFGPVLDDSLDVNEGKIVKLLLQNLPKSGHFDFKTFLPNQDVLVFKELGWSVSVLQTHIVAEKQSYGIEQLNDSKKRELNKLQSAERAGRIKLIENKLSNLNVIQELWKETALRAGFDPKSGITQRILNSGLPNYNNIIVDDRGTPLCGSFCLKDEFTVYHLISANRRVEDKLLSKANVLALYKSIKFANDRGLTFDTEGSSIPGVAQFYRFMGAQPKFIFRVQKSPSLYYQFIRWLAQLRREYA
jgi:hypothetical protein